MPRSAPSSGVLAVVEELRARGVDLSARQIESLQDREALPKGEHVHDGGSGSRIVLPDDFANRAEAAARLPVRQRSAANVAAVLYVAGHQIDEQGALAIRERARELLEGVTKAVADVDGLQEQIRSSRSAQVRRTRRTTQAVLNDDAAIHDEEPIQADGVLAHELHDVGGLLTGDEGSEVDEGLLADAMVDPTLLSLLSSVVGDLGSMLSAVGRAPELVTVESLEATRPIWQILLPDATLADVATQDPDSLVSMIAAVVGIAGREDGL